MLTAEVATSTQTVSSGERRRSPSLERTPSRFLVGFMTKDYAKGSPLISIARPNLVRQTSENTVKRKSNFGERRLGEVRPGNGNTKPERYRYRYRTVSGGRLQKRGRILAWGLRFCEVLETNPMQGGPARRRGADNGSDARSADGHCSAYSDPKKEKSHIPEQKEPRKSGSVPTPWVLHPHDVASMRRRKRLRSLVEIGVLGGCNACVRQEND
jgi:hypothetical protein